MKSISMCMLAHILIETFIRLPVVKNEYNFSSDILQPSCCILLGRWNNKAILSLLVVQRMVHTLEEVVLFFVPTT